MGRKIPLWLLLLVVFLGINGAVLFGWAVQYVHEGGKRLGSLAPAITTVASFPSLVKQALYEVGLLHYEPQTGKTEDVTRPPQLIANRFPELDGFRRNGVYQAGAARDDGYLLESLFDNNRGQAVVRLVRIRDGKTLHEWVPNIGNLAALSDRSKYNLDFFPAEIRPTRYRIFHPLLLNDGSLIFHGNGPMYRIDACSNVEWIIDKHFTHAIEQDADGNIWTSSLVEPSTYTNPYFDGYIDESIAKVSPEGKVLFEKSVSRILDENGDHGLLFGVAPYSKADNIHLNDVQPALYSTKYWEKGDLLISVRNRSAIFLYRPSTNRIIWQKVGPWLLQHDPDFVGDSKISIFGNDVLRRTTDHKEILEHGHSDIYVYNFADNTVSTPYTTVMKQADVGITTEGLQRILDNGDVFVEESMAGRLLRLSQHDIVWEAVSKIDDNTLSLLSWSRYLTPSQVKQVLPLLESTHCQ